MAILKQRGNGNGHTIVDMPEVSKERRASNKPRVAVYALLALVILAGLGWYSSGPSALATTPETDSGTGPQSEFIVDPSKVSTGGRRDVDTIKSMPPKKAKDDDTETQSVKPRPRPPKVIVEPDRKKPPKVSPPPVVEPIVRQRPGDVFDLSLRYEIIPNNAASKRLTWMGLSPTAGSKMMIWDRDGSAAQQWRLIRSEDGSAYSIHPADNLRLAIGNKDLAGQVTRLEPTDPNSPHQNWQLQRCSDDGRTRIILLNDEAAHSIRVLDVAGFRTDNGADVHTWAVLTGNSNQKFTFKAIEAAAIPTPPVPDAGTSLDLSLQYYIVPKHAPAKVLSIVVQRSYAGAKVRIWRNERRNSQKWTISQHMDGRGRSYYSFHPSHAPMMALDGNFKALEQVHLWNTQNSNLNQLFTLEAVEGEERTFVLRLNSPCCRVLDVGGRLKTDGAAVITYDRFMNADNQRFIFQPIESVLPRADGQTRYSIMVKARTTAVFGVTGGDQGGEGAKVMLWQSDGTENQRWTLQKAGDGGAVSFRPSHRTDLALSNGGAMQAIRLWEAHSSEDQRFFLETVDAEKNTFRLKTGSGGYLGVADFAVKSKSEAADALNGAQVRTWEKKNDQDNQKFVFYEA